MFVFSEDPAEAVASVDIQVGEAVPVGDRFRQWCQRPGVRDPLIRPVAVVEDLELAQRGQQEVWTGLHLLGLTAEARDIFGSRESFLADPAVAYVLRRDPRLALQVDAISPPSC